tara:strand:+ start:698 stop:889 length:192 start_codon:yes stop_codon:yes gene_type:complete
MSKENTMRDTKNEFNEAMAGFETAMKDLKHHTRAPLLLNGVLSMLIFCIPALTISTILWQWIG